MSVQQRLVFLMNNDKFRMLQRNNKFRERDIKEYETHTAKMCWLFSKKNRKG
jgi:hypothetical protein